MPTEIAKVSTAMPSVTRPGGACCSIRLNPVISTGEQPKPETRMTAASSDLVGYRLR